MLTILIAGICFLLVPEAVRSDSNAAPTGPTIIENQYNVKNDVAAINAAFKANPVDLRKITDILTKRTVKQRIAIKQTYKSTYGVPLPGSIINVSNGKIMFFLVRLLYSPVEYAARDIKFSLDFSHDWSYMSILSTSNGKQLTKIANKYNQIFNMNIDDELKKEMRLKSGKEFVTRMIDDSINGAGRPESGCDVNLFGDEMQCIPTEGARCAIGKNENLFQLLSKQSFDCLRDFSVAYYNEHNKVVFDLLHKYCGKGDTKEGYLRILRYSYSPVVYNSVELFNGIVSQGATRDGADRIIIQRSEIDLLDVQQMFYKIFNMTVPAVIDIIYGNTDSDYTYALKSMLTGNK